MTLVLPSTTPIADIGRLIASTRDPRLADTYRTATGLSRSDRAAAFVIAAALEDPDPPAAAVAATRMLVALHTQRSAGGPFNDWLSRTVATAAIQAAVTEPDDAIVHAAARILHRIEEETGVRSGFTAAQLDVAHQAAARRPQRDDPGHVRATAIYRAVLWLFIAAVIAGGLLVTLFDHDSAPSPEPDISTSAPATTPAPEASVPEPVPATDPPATTTTARTATPAPTTTAGAPSAGARSGPYANCSAARAAGAAPVYSGDPGYGRHLDRDNDGIGCE